MQFPASNAGDDAGNESVTVSLHLQTGSHGANGSCPGIKGKGKKKERKKEHVMMLIHGAN